MVTDVHADAVRQAAETLKAAVDQHLAAVERRAGESDPAVQAAFDVLHVAAEEYDDLLYEVYEEVTPFEFSDGPDEEDVVDAPVVDGHDDEPGQPRVTVVARRDYTVVDSDALASAAGAHPGTAHDLDGVPTDEPAVAARAVYGLLHARGLDGLDETAEDSGLRPEGGTIWLLLAEPDDTSLFDAPFAGIDPESLVHRMDEVYED